MSIRSSRFVLAFVLAWASSGILARAQCLDWRTFPVSPAPPYVVQINAVQVFDDGSGPALYMGRSQVSGGADPAFSGVQRLDGDHFTDLGLPGAVQCLAVFDDGTGPALYAGGLFTVPGTTSTNMAKWDGSAWLPLGSGPINVVWTLAVHDDGTGPGLFAGGGFGQAGGVPTLLVAKWNGSAWSACSGLPGSGAQVFTLLSFDDSTGPALFAGSSSFGVRKWQNGSWTPLPGATGIIRGLAAYDDGSGPALYSGGVDGVRRWNGTTWIPVGTSGQVQGLAALDVGGGPTLYAGSPIFGSCRVLRWDGSQWTPLAGSAPPACTIGDLKVQALSVFDSGSGPRIVAGTTEGAFGAVTHTLWSWTGAAWQHLGPSAAGLRGSEVRALHVHDDGSGPALYAAGFFCGADETGASLIARWTGETWSAMPITNYGEWLDFATFGPGPIPALFASGAGARLWKWDGFAWSNLGGSQWLVDTVFALEPSGSDLYLGGSFTTMNSIASPNICRWNGSTFLPVGSGSQAGVNGAVNALETFDDGSGPALYAGGTFMSGNGVPMNRIGRWDGTNWTPLGSGMNGLVDALLSFDNGTGPALYAAGIFSDAGGIPASCIARWNGTSWLPLGEGLNAQVLSLAVFDDGSGPALYAGGNFTASGSTPMSGVARWNGVSWSAVAGGTDGPVWALQAHDDGTGIGSQLFLGGAFHHAGPQASELFAAWRGCAGTISKFCFGDGSVAACPCGNRGLSGRGCDNSLSTGGARLNATGITSPDTIVLYAGGELPNAATLVFQGETLLTTAIVFGDGLRCAGTVRRMYTTAAVNGTISVPGPGQMSISARSAALGDPLLPGAVRCYQAWYRDPNLAFCAPPSGNAWNLSNAVRIVW